jgi:hypothetical protein
VKVLQGQPVNLAFPIIGRVSRNGRRLCLKKDTIYVSEEIKGNRWGYAGIIAGSMHGGKLRKGKPPIFGLSTSDLAFLEEGDVILLESSGSVTVLWDTDSPHNTIFLTNTCNCK